MTASSVSAGVWKEMVPNGMFFRPKEKRSEEPLKRDKQLLKMIHSFVLQ